MATRTHLNVTLHLHVHCLSSVYLTYLTRTEMWTQSPTCFGTSWVPSSGSPYIS